MQQALTNHQEELFANQIQVKKLRESDCLRAVKCKIGVKSTTALSLWANVKFF